MSHKLLFVITQPVVGGAQKYVFDLARHFNQAAKYDVAVAIGQPPDGDLFQKLAVCKIKTHCLKFLSREVKIGDDILAFFELLKLFREERPDIIHLNSSKVGALGSLAAFFYKLTTNNYRPKTIFTAHGWVFKEKLSCWTRSAAILLAWFSAKFQDRLICVSRDDFNRALKYKVAPPRKLYVVHNAVAAGEKFLTKEKAREEISKIIGHELEPETFILVGPGRLYATKGLKYLVEAVSNLGASLPSKKIVLVIFGDGPEREALKLQTTSYKLQDSIFLAGDVSEMAKYLKAFDALVLSSIKEGLPYSILEAGWAGVPVVATNVGGIGEIIENEKSGLLVKPQSTHALAEAVKKLIDLPDLSKQLSLQLKKTVAQRFNFENMAVQTEWVYKV